MDPFFLILWALRLLFLALLYLVLFWIVRLLVRDLRSAARQSSVELGRLVVVRSPSGDPAPGTVFILDAVSTIGRDVNNSIVVDDAFVSGTHAALTFRGRAWYVEDLGSTNGTFVNGLPVVEPTLLGFGDEIAIGETRLRLDRGRRSDERR
jgi:hypothetical protein